LVRGGRDALSTNKVAERAGVSIGSLYQYFPDKEAILAELGRRHVEEARALVSGRLLSLAAAPPAEAVRVMVALMIELHRHDPALHRVLVREVVPGLAGLAALEAELSGMVAAYLETHRAALRVADRALAAAVVTQVVESLTHGAVLYRPELLGTRAFEDEVVDLVTRYLLPDRPPAPRSPRAATARPRRTSPGSIST
jgi:AcrR family transcriptional regulator